LGNEIPDAGLSGFLPGAGEETGKTVFFVRLVDDTFIFFN